ncbi:MAG: alpha/beta family hydrolase [Hyphomicrobium sp.]
MSLCWAADGDHDLGPRGNSGFTRKGNMASAVAVVAAFCNGLGGGIARRPAPTP